VRVGQLRLARWASSGSRGSLQAGAHQGALRISPRARAEREERAHKAHASTSRAPPPPPPPPRCAGVRLCEDGAEPGTCPALSGLLRAPRDGGGRDDEPDEVEVLRPGQGGHALGGRVLPCDHGVQADLSRPASEGELPAWAGPWPPPGGGEGTSMPPTRPPSHPASFPPRLLPPFNLPPDPLNSLDSHRTLHVQSACHSSVHR